MEIKKVAFVGSGVIGCGLATNCIMNGVPVVMQDIKPAAEAEQRIRENLTFYLNNGIIDEAEFERALSLTSYTQSLEEAVTGAQFIQESGPEKLEIKQSILAQIEQYADPAAIIASSTSGLSITAIFSTAVHPERGVGCHPYLPSHLMPLVEITKGEKTDAAFAQIALDFYKKVGKEPVLLNKEVIGFIANRYSTAIHREMVDLVMNGVCSVEDADKALTYSLGIRWAIMGQAMALHLSATPDGMRNFTTKYHWVPGTPNKRLEALATWTTFPEGWDKVLADGLDEAIAKRPPETGNDIKGIETWRDQMLLSILRLHGKL